MGKGIALAGGCVKDTGHLLSHVLPASLQLGSGEDPPRDGSACGASPPLSEEDYARM